MGPLCPHCKSQIEWTTGEIDETVYSGKMYFCAAPDCFQMFWLSLEDVEFEQEKCRKMFAEEKEVSDDAPDIDWKAVLEQEKIDEEEAFERYSIMLEEKQKEQRLKDLRDGRE